MVIRKYAQHCSWCFSHFRETKILPIIISLKVLMCWWSIDWLTIINTGPAALYWSTALGAQTLLYPLIYASLSPSYPDGCALTLHRDDQVVIWLSLSLTPMSATNWCWPLYLQSDPLSVVLVTGRGVSSRAVGCIKVELSRIVLWRDDVSSEWAV